MYALATRHRQTLKVEPVFILYFLFCVLLEHQLVPAYFDVKMRARYAKCVHVGRSVLCTSVWIKSSAKWLNVNVMLIQYLCTCGLAFAMSRSWRVTSWMISFFLCTSPLGSGTYSSASRSNSVANVSQRPCLWTTNHSTDKGKQGYTSTKCYRLRKEWTIGQPKLGLKKCVCLPWQLHCWIRCRWRLLPLPSLSADSHRCWDPATIRTHTHRHILLLQLNAVNPNNYIILLSIINFLLYTISISNRLLSKFTIFQTQTNLELLGAFSSLEADDDVADGFPVSTHGVLRLTGAQLRHLPLIHLLSLFNTQPYAHIHSYWLLTLLTQQVYAYCVWPVQSPN